MNCIVCGEERPGITLTAYGVRVFACEECVGKGVDVGTKAVRRLIKKKVPKVFKALAGAATISKLLRRDA